ncbi:iron-containing redox enzyme family protein [Vallicoccus soli]|uniref:Iron-containing redox enzyme family protein n=1 Tax=Vallicoccus soli TaxID=2339232 RepID=A0A3A3YPY0_9ACTN|nr:iron-containing redox enzyme family protein [Vallicoccus soli]RJK92763.1 iron-containing redox enzyme family protein [Vallicoccus soli]
MRLPDPRGTISAALVDHLRDDAPLDPATVERLRGLAAAVEDPLGDGDLQLALAVAYEPHYSGFEGVGDHWEWDPGLLGVRAGLERRFEEGLRAEVGDAAQVRAGVPVDVALRDVLEHPRLTAGPSLSRWVMRHADEEQFREMLRQRSVYQLREADPHTWAIPRITGPAKAALIEIQADEYGGGRYERMHSVLFARTMRAFGLDTTYGAYWPLATPATLATNNLITYFGLHRRWRGALLGHLAGVEMDSSAPCRRFANALRRLGYGEDATFFYDEHVEADAVHEQLAAVDMCGGFVGEDPQRYADVLFGAASLVAVEGRFAQALVGPWEAAAAAA